MDATAPIIHQRALPVGPSEAFDAWVSMGRWWPPRYTPDADTFADAQVGPGVGAPVVLRHRDLGDVEIGRVTAWEPGVRLAHTFHLAMPDSHPSALDVRFEPADGGSRLHFEHGGWSPDNATWRAKYGDWPLILDAYVAVLAP